VAAATWRERTFAMICWPLSRWWTYISYSNHFKINWFDLAANIWYHLSTFWFPVPMLHLSLQVSEMLGGSLLLKLLIFEFLLTLPVSWDSSLSLYDLLNP
jgi:hypothetical protein